MSTGWNWKALAEAVLMQRQAYGWTQEDLAARASTSARTVFNLESGHPRMRIPTTLGRIENALGWEPGHALNLLNTGSHLDVGAVEALQADLNCAVVTVNARRLQAVLAELELLRSRLAKYEPLPVLSEDDETP